MSSPEERLAAVRSSIAEAADRAGRDDEVGLIAVSKTVSADRILEVYQAGQHVFGENRVQEALAKAEALKESAPGLQWHLIGHLQSNKAKPAAQTFSMV